MPCLSHSALKMAVWWPVAPWILVQVYRRFRGGCCLQQQTSVFNKITQRKNPEDSHLHIRRSENLKSNSFHSVTEIIMLVIRWTNSEEFSKLCQRSMQTVAYDYGQTRSEIEAYLSSSTFCWDIKWQVAFQVLTGANMKMAAFWVVASCRLVEIYRGLDDGGSKHLWNVGEPLAVNAGQHPRRQPSS
jgi:hypothetical protein